NFVERCLSFLVTLPAVLRNGIVNWKKRFASRGEQNQGRNYQAQGIKLLHVCRTFAKNSVQGDALIYHGSGELPVGEQPRRMPDSGIRTGRCNSGIVQLT